jgi:PAT family beta-lactamase induction signal transducer AmpG
MRLNASIRWTSLLAAVSIYLRPHVLIIWLLGFSAGLPLALSGATLSVWMADHGVDLETIGLLSLAGLPYAVKFLWAPIVDALDVPLLGAHLGRRRGWMVASQITLIAAILFLGTRDPLSAPLAVGLGALLVATASATQDIAIDAFRIESLKSDEQAAGMASYVAAYRIGMLVSGAGVIALTAWLEAGGLAKQVTWPIAYGISAVLVLVGMFAVLFAAEPKAAHSSDGASKPGLAHLAGATRAAVTELLSREAVVAVLAFVVLYKLCDALAGTLTGPFVLALGYDKATYAAIVKVVGLIASILGGFAGGMLAHQLSLARSLWLGALLQMTSNIAFIWLATVPPSVPALTSVILIENFTGGIGTVIFVAYLSVLCANPAHTATHYALLTALAAVGRTLIASLSGYAASSLGWALFFLATTAAAVPSLMLLGRLQLRGHFDGLGRASTTSPRAMPNAS